MDTPLLATPAASSPAKCGVCKTTLIRTGKPVTFGDESATPASRVYLKGPDAPATNVRGHRAFRGWVPALLVAICPKCDTWAAPDVDEDAPLTLEQPTLAVAAEGYLERLGREADVALQKALKAQKQREYRARKKKERDDAP